MNEVPTVDSMLNSDLSGIDSGFPVLENQVVNAVIAECVREDSKNGKPVLRFKFTTSHPCKTTSGMVKPAGFTLRHMVSLTPTYESDGTTLKYDPRQNLKQIKEAVFGEGTGPFGEPALYIGKSVTFRVKVTQSDEFGTQNAIAAFIKSQAH